MPPKSSSDSNKKSIGKNKDEEKLKREEEEEKKFVDEFYTTPLGRRYAELHRIAAASAAASAAPAAAGGNKALTLTTPDIPPCDGCAKPFSGTMQCSKCESVFYCGRECQVSHWTAAAGGHKSGCKVLRERNEEIARRVLGDFFTHPLDWRALDVAGAYNAAVRQGLHDKIRLVLLFDYAELVYRYRTEDYVCYAQCVMATLFRGQRAEGRAGARSPAASCMDGPRIKGYVNSHPEALDAWLRASIEIIRAAIDPATLHKAPCHRSAKMVWKGWMLVFTSSTASRAIFAPSTPSTVGTGADERQRRNDHAYRVVKAFVEAYKVVLSATPGPHAASDVLQLETTVSHALAMVLVRADEYGLGIDVDGMLKLDLLRKESLQHYLIPVARQTIKKGGDLTEEELDTATATAIYRTSLRCESEGRGGD